MRSRGFLLGATAGRTTLNGEGLQHEDGHSMVQAGLIPNVRSYDPTFAYEVVTLIQHGMQRMLAEQHDEYWYITLMNENYRHPDMPEGSAEGIIKGMYHFSSTSPAGGRGRAGKAGEGEGSASKKKSNVPHVQLMGSGTILREVIAAAELLEGRQGPAIAATDYIRNYADQIREYVPMRYTVLGTDGYGRSDTRANLRRFFEVDRHYIAHAAIAALAAEGKMTAKDVARAIKQYKIDTDKPNPITV